MTKASEKQLESVIIFNVKMLLTARGYSQSALAEAMGIGRSAMSLKMSGKTGWSVVDLVNAARFLNAGVEQLLDSTLMQQMGVKHTEKASTEVEASNKLLRLGLNQRPSDYQFQETSNDADFRLWEHEMLNQSTVN